MPLIMVENPYSRAKLGKEVSSPDVLAISPRAGKTKVKRTNLGVREI